MILGIWPAPLMEVMHASVENLVSHVSHCKLPASEAADCVLAVPASVVGLTGQP
jgi:NADH-quinone oxidoreductase subunit M